MRRPTADTMRSMMFSRCASSLKRTSVSSSLPRRSTYTCCGPLTRMSETVGSASSGSSGPRPEHLVLDAADDALARSDAERRALLGEQAFADLPDLPPRVLVFDAREQRQIEHLQQALVDRFLPFALGRRQRTHAIVLSSPLVRADIQRTSCLSALIDALPLSKFDKVRASTPDRRCGGRPPSCVSQRHDRSRDRGVARILEQRRAAVDALRDRREVVRHQQRIIRRRATSDVARP